MEIFPVFLIKSGASIPCPVGCFKLASGDKLPALLVGEQGRNRELGVLPVELAQEGRKQWDVCYLQAETAPPPTIEWATLAKTVRGAPKLLQAPPPTKTPARAIVVLATHFGFRGSNSHTGDRTGQNDQDGLIQFHPFPGEILVRGVIADGIAGRQARGEQCIAILPVGQVFRTAYTGRLYGAPDAHYHVYTGGQILSATWEERQVTELF